MRLLEQTTFGPTEALVAHVNAVGVDASSTSSSRRRAAILEHKHVPAGRPATCCTTDPNPALLPATTTRCSSCSAILPQRARGPRPVAPARRVRAVADLRHLGRRHQRGLRDAALPADLRRPRVRQLRGLLTRVTLSPVMGDYLDMVNNDKPRATGAEPNENYAREILQLFSIGTVGAEPDGTPLLDAAASRSHLRPGRGRRLRARLHRLDLSDCARRRRAHRQPPELRWATWRQSLAITTSARRAARRRGRPGGPRDARRSRDRDPQHLPAPQRRAVHRQAADPEARDRRSLAAYVARVAAVFNNNGAGVRGDLKAVVRAILLDPEARGALKLDPGYGKLREPVLYLDRRGARAQREADGVYFRARRRALGQTSSMPPRSSTTTRPITSCRGTTRSAPSSAPEHDHGHHRANFANTLAFADDRAARRPYPGATGTQLDWTRADRARRRSRTRWSTSSIALLLHGTMSRGDAQR